MLAITTPTGALNSVLLSNITLNLMQSYFSPVFDISASASDVIVEKFNAKSSTFREMIKVSLARSFIMQSTSKFENISSFFIQDLTKGSLLTLDTITSFVSLDRVNITNSSFLT